MAIDPKAFSPNTQDFAHAAPGFFPHTEDFAHSGTDSLQTPDFARTGQRQLRAMFGGKASLNSLFSGGDDATDAPVATTPTTSPTEPLATPGLGAAEPAGSPSLLSSERVPVVPNFATASPLLTGGQQIGAEIGEAQRGEEGVLGGGAGRQGMSTADRNRALMSFFRPQQAQSQQGTAQTSEPSDAMKAVGSAKSAIGAGGRAKNLLSQKSPGMGFSGADWSGADWGMPDKFTPGGLTAHEQMGVPATGTPETGDQFGTDPSSAPSASTRDATGTTPGSSSFGMPDSSNPSTYAGMLGFLGSLAALFGNASSNPTAKAGGGAAVVAGQGANAAIDPNIGNAGSAVGAGLGLAGTLSDNPDLATTGKAVGAGSQAAQAAYSAYNGGGAPTGGWGGVLAGASRLGTGAYGLSNSDASDRDKAIEAAHTVGMALADYYTGGLAEIGPMLGGLIGSDNPLGQMLLGGPALMGKHAGASHYDLVRSGPERQAQKEVEGLRGLFSSIPQGDMAKTYGALRAQLDPRGAIRSYFQPSAADASAMGLPENPAGGYYNWRDMNPQQFGAAMDWLSQDPARLDSIMGSGDLGYLNQGTASQHAGQASTAARALIARQLGLPYIEANYGAGYDAPSPYEHLGEGDIASMTNAEQQYQSERDQFGAKHPGVALRSWTPQYLGRQPMLNDLMTPPSEMSGVYADPTRKWDQAGGG